MVHSQIPSGAKTQSDVDAKGPNCLDEEASRRKSRRTQLSEAVLFFRRASA